MVFSVVAVVLLTQHWTGEQYVSLGRMKACKMWTQQLLLSADSNRLSTPIS